MSRVKKVLWGLAAAFTTPEAVRAEKSLAAVVVARAAVLIPSAAFILDAVARWLS